MLERFRENHRIDEQMPIDDSPEGWRISRRRVVAIVGLLSAVPIVGYPLYLALGLDEVVGDMVLSELQSDEDITLPQNMSLPENTTINGNTVTPAGGRVTTNPSPEQSSSQQSALSQPDQAICTNIVEARTESWLEAFANAHNNITEVPPCKTMLGSNNIHVPSIVDYQDHPHYHGKIADVNTGVLNGIKTLSQNTGLDDGSAMILMNHMITRSVVVKPETYSEQVRLSLSGWMSELGQLMTVKPRLICFTPSSKRSASGMQMFEYAKQWAEQHGFSVETLADSPTKKSSFNISRGDVVIAKFFVAKSARNYQTEVRNWLDSIPANQEKEVHIWTDNITTGTEVSSMAGNIATAITGHSRNNEFAMNGCTSDSTKLDIRTTYTTGNGLPILKALVETARTPDHVPGEISLRVDVKVPSWLEVIGQIKEATQTQPYFFSQSLRNLFASHTLDNVIRMMGLRHEAVAGILNKPGSRNTRGSERDLSLNPIYGRENDRIFRVSARSESGVQDANLKLIGHPESITMRYMLTPANWS